MGTRASFLYAPHSQAVVLDLAVQAAGLASVPQPLPPGGVPVLRVEVEGGVVDLPAWEDAARTGGPPPDPERLAAGSGDDLD
ncbi:MAG TPA: hypothetical protein DD490_29120, partial [Acidobacteria bacterium]|nr:hypothetical protein [Acidobacteriota bacterium]